MHEIAVLMKACDMAEQIAKDNRIRRIAYLRLEVGELTGYLPVFFEKYYPIAIEGRPVFEGSELIIDEVRGEGMCNACHSLYNIMKHEGRCPKCGSRDKTILGGQTFKIKDIGVAQEEEGDFEGSKEAPAGT